MRSKLVFCLSLMAMFNATMLFSADPPDELNELRKAYEEELAAIDTEHDQRLQDIIAVYTAELKDLKKSLAKKQDLEGLVFVVKELKRMESEPGLPKPSTPAMPSALKGLHSRIFRSVDRARQTKVDRTLSAMQRYAKHLAVLKGRLTRAMNVEAALLVKKELEKVEDNMVLKAAKSAAGAWPTALKKDLVLWFDFKDDLKDRVMDRSGNKNYARVQGPRRVSDKEAGPAFEFNGKKHCLLVSPKAKGFPLGNFTMSVYFKTSGKGALVGSGEYAGYPMSWRLRPVNFEWAWKSNRKSLSGVLVHKLDFKCENNRWNHLMVTRSKNIFTVFLNGKKVAAATDFPSGRFPIYNNGLMVGNMKRDGGKFLNYTPFQGRIAHVMIWRRCLSDEEAGTVGHLVRMLSK